jgi:hypothetical protein
VHLLRGAAAWPPWWPWWTTGMDTVWFQKDELATLRLRSQVRGVTKAEARLAGVWRARGESACESGSYQGRLRGRFLGRGFLDRHHQRLASSRDFGCRARRVQWPAGPRRLSAIAHVPRNMAVCASSRLGGLRQPPSDVTPPAITKRACMRGALGRKGKAAALSLPVVRKFVRATQANRLLAMPPG